ncbi:MAG: hypothetical protein P8Y53_23695 [Pseudolabrys sp.]
MGFIVLVITVCAVSHPSQCEDRQLEYVSHGESLRQCAMAAPPYIARYIDRHPKWRAVRWHCEYPGQHRI